MGWDSTQHGAGACLEQGYNKLKSQEEVGIDYSFPVKPGTYIFIKDGKTVYAGEASELKRRMYRHKKRTRVSTLRRAIGNIVFGQAKSKKYDGSTEKKIDAYIRGLGIKYIEAGLGRKELEEYIIRKDSPVYNTLSKPDKNS